MVIVTLASLLTVFFSLLWFHFHRNIDGKPSSLPRDLPIFGMILPLLLNLHRFVDFVVEVLKESGGTFFVRGPWFTKMELLITTDPEDIRYIMSKNHHSFSHGANFKQIFQLLGDGIINSDGEMWKYQRKIGLSYFTSAQFRHLMAKTVKHKVDQGLIPLLERFCSHGSKFDLQDVMKRLTGDITFLWLTGHDPNYISFNTSNDLLRDLGHMAEDVVAQRHVLPSSIWKLLKWLKIGKEGELCELEEAANSFIYEIIRKKRVEVMKMRDESENERVSIKGDDFMSVCITENYGTNNDMFKSRDIFLRDTFMNFLLAGQDTVGSVLAWLFWLLIKHPQVEAKITEELAREGFNIGYDVSQLNDPTKMVYLHATICETLRLYPPVPFNHRSPKKSETLPSGYQVKPWTTIILCSHAMGRMKQVWGEDCEDFKPKRWITEEGTIRHEPSHKFFAFNTGPRICLGKEMTMVQMKAIVCAVLHRNFRFKLVEEHRVEPAFSVALRMKYGLKVRVTKNAEP